MVFPRFHLDDGRNPYMLNESTTASSSLLRGTCSGFTGVLPACVTSGRSFLVRAA
jgi:hypothetical protein